jgi:hypothetical protein
MKSAGFLLNLEGILEKLPVAYQGDDGKSFYGKLDDGYLSFFHYIQGPAKMKGLDSIKNFGENLDQYRDILRAHNGFIMYDKALSLYGIGENIIRSLSISDQIAYRVEDENPIFEILSKDAILSRPRKVGRLDLNNSYEISIQPDGHCALYYKNKVIIDFESICEAYISVISIMEEICTFPNKISDLEKGVVEKKLFTL